MIRRRTHRDYRLGFMGIKLEESCFKNCKNKKWRWLKLRFTTWQLGWVSNDGNAKRGYR